MAGRQRRRAARPRRLRPHVAVPGNHQFRPHPPGLVVKYDAYTIAPYSHGQPEILIPYERLRGVLRPEFIPAG